MELELILGLVGFGLEGYFGCGELNEHSIFRRCLMDISLVGLGVVG